MEPHTADRQVKEGRESGPERTRLAGFAAVVRLTAIAGAGALIVAQPAHAGDIDGAPVEETATLKGAPLMAALAPAMAVAEEAETLGAPQVRRLGVRLQCVPYAREQSGVEIYGDAVKWWRKAAGQFERIHNPETGAVIVMRGYHNASKGHVAVVRHVLSDRSIIVDHANWLNSGEVTVNVPMVDVSPGNDWSQVRVWHIPTQSWGMRVYNVQGFIRPPAQPPGSGGAPTTTAR